MIIEGLLTTLDVNGVVNVAPMGPIVHEDFQSLTLRPFRGSTTFQNLIDTGCGVFHIVDRVNIIAEAAIRRLGTCPETFAAQMVTGVVLEDCCRWFEFEVSETDTTNERSTMLAEILHSGSRRPFRGFNRARHAVIEAAILATRLHILSQEDVESAMRFLLPAVEKTGDSEEVAAFELLQQHVRQFFGKGPSA